MTAKPMSSGRKGRTRAIVAIMLAMSAGSLFLTTELPSGVPLGTRASAALAELAARSPGMRMGGVSLKAKIRRAAVLPVADLAPGDAATPARESAVGPEGSVPTIGAIGPGDLSGVFGAPEIPALASAPTVPASPSYDFGTSNIPPIGGVAIFGGPGGGTGGGPGGGGGTILPPPPPVIPGIPEPGLWLMLMSGFGLIGASMRRERRARTA